MRPALTLSEAAWLARCLGRGEQVPLGADDQERPSQRLGARMLCAGARLFAQGDRPGAVWVIRSGEVELAPRVGVRKHVVQVLYRRGHHRRHRADPEHAARFGARAVEETLVLRIGRHDFEELLADHRRIARRCLSCVAMRLAGSQRRNPAPAGARPASQTRARAGRGGARGRGAALPGDARRAAGVRRPSVNKVLKEFEAAGRVDLSYRRVTLRDEHALRRAAG